MRVESEDHFAVHSCRFISRTLVWPAHSSLKVSIINIEFSGATTELWHKWEYIDLDVYSGKEMGSNPSLKEVFGKYISLIHST